MSQLPKNMVSLYRQHSHEAPHCSVQCHPAMLTFLKHLKTLYKHVPHYLLHAGYRQCDCWQLRDRLLFISTSYFPTSVLFFVCQILASLPM